MNVNKLSVRSDVKCEIITQTGAEMCIYNISHVEKETFTKKVARKYTVSSFWTDKYKSINQNYKCLFTKMCFNFEFDILNWRMLIRINEYSILLLHITFFPNNIKHCLKITWTMMKIDLFFRIVFWKLI